jgi:Icc-related predicted phosphoesterase
MKITFISDTHSSQSFIPNEDLLGGDLIIHSGDYSNRGFFNETLDFFEWFSSLNYEYKIFIAGNHDFIFQDDPNKALESLKSYPDIIYLKDSSFEYNGIKIWGSPWQPVFYNWAFNLPRNGPEILSKWKMIPGDTDILITHGPPHGILDHLPNGFNCGCELLYDEISKYINPKIHCFGHIHNGYGIRELNDTIYINASNLDEDYKYRNKPISVEIDEFKKIKKQE